MIFRDISNAKIVTKKYRDFVDKAPSVEPYPFFVS